VVRFCNELSSHRTDRSIRHTCSHQRQKAGSVRTCQTPARRHSSTWRRRPPFIGWIACRHGTTYDAAGYTRRLKKWHTQLLRRPGQRLMIGRCADYAVWWLHYITTF